MSSQLFGVLDELALIPGSISVILIIFIIFVLERLFETLNKLTDDTPFQTMVISIQKELMIVGCMAFVFKIMIATTDFLNDEWLISLSYAGIVLY